MNPTTWCGLSSEQVLGVFDEQHWRLRTATTLIRVAHDRDLRADQRTEALQYLNEMGQLGFFPTEIPLVGVSTLVRDVLLLIMAGPRPRWWRFRRRKVATDQLKAARVMIRTMMQFVGEPTAAIDETTKLFS